MLIGEGFLATSDSEPDNEKWGISLKNLRELLRDSPVRQQIIWLDCCGELRQRHRAVGKESGQTNHIERLNNTFSCFSCSTWSSLAFSSCFS